MSSLPDEVVKEFGDHTFYYRSAVEDVVVLVRRLAIEECAMVCEETEPAPDAGLKENIWHAAAITRCAEACRSLLKGTPS